MLSFFQRCAMRSPCSTRTGTVSLRQKSCVLLCIHCDNTPLKRRYKKWLTRSTWTVGCTAHALNLSRNFRFLTLLPLPLSCYPFRSLYFTNHLFVYILKALTLLPIFFSWKFFFIFDSNLIIFCPGSSIWQNHHWFGSCVGNELLYAF